ncbi:uncharacterized protein J4E79_011188 [Alternaria viburni]|uniref:uncharacterized protein n=1 Tax=Alternaria viburni TaxID=566460 RepID=UPI0020C2626E|nr:uncharacterized protein J4E79_011188 [Alternaria viburni]KAI4643916.1 hypothetical protein J4E79_011188 [Alternaria viburni]
MIRLLFQIINIASDIVFFRTKVNLSPTNLENEPLEQNPGPPLDASLTSKAKRLLMKADISRALIPLLFTTLSVVIVSVLFSGASDTYRATENACSTKPDADISGVGVRASIWGQIAMLILISSSGHLHKKETAIKEVAGGLILTHVSLAIAIIVQMYKKTLTSVDAAIGAVILDAQNIALLIPVTAKQTLAARWQVLILIPAQILGLVFLPVLVVKFTKGGFASKDCKCLTIFWWSRLSDCNAFSGNELSLFWIYYTLRWMMWIHSSFHSLYNAEWFHRSEKEGRIPILNRDGTKPKTYWEKAIALARELRDSNRQVTKATLQAGLLYRQYSATISVSYTAYALYSLTSMVVAEVTIGEYNLQPSSNANSIGQIIAVVVSLATLLRVVWSFQSLYNDAENSSFPDFIFSLLSRSPSSCCFGSNVEEASEDPALILSRPDEEQPGRISDTDSGHGGSGGSLPPQTPARSSQSSHGAVGLADQHLGPNPGSPHPSNSRNSSDSANLPKTQPHLPLGQNGRAQRLPPNRAVPQPKRTASYRPAYRFEFHQPFHLDAVKLLFLPTVTQYLEARKESKATVPISETMIPPLITPPTLDQPSACIPPEQLQQDTGKKEASPPRLVVEASTSADDEYPVMTSAKPPDSLHGNRMSETGGFDSTDQPQKGQVLAELHPQSAIRRDMTPAPISTLPGPQKYEPTAAQKSEEQQPASLGFPIQMPEEGRKGTQSGVPQGDVSKHTVKNIPAPEWLLGLESKIGHPGIADPSESGEGSQSSDSESEKSRTSIRSVDHIDTGPDMDDPRTTDQSADSIYHKRFQLEAPKSSLNKVDETLPERPIPSRASHQWNRVLMDLGIIHRRQLPHGLLERWVARKWRRVTQEAKRRKKIPYEPDVRSGCPGISRLCKKGPTIWEDYPPFRTHFETHLKDPFYKSRNNLACISCLRFYTFAFADPGFWDVESDTSTYAKLVFMDVEDLVWHIWDKHMHKVERDPSSPPLAKAEQGKGKSAEASKLEAKQPIDAEMGGTGGLETTIDRNVF